MILCSIDFTFVCPSAFDLIFMTVYGKLAMCTGINIKLRFKPFPGGRKRGLNYLMFSDRKFCENMD